MFSYLQSYSFDIVIYSCSLVSIRVFARLSESYFSIFFAGLGINGGAIINFFSFYMMGDFFSLSSKVIEGGLCNFYIDFFEDCPFWLFFSVLNVFSYSSLFLEVLLITGVCILTFFSLLFYLWLLTFFSTLLLCTYNFGNILSFLSWGIFYRISFFLILSLSYLLLWMLYLLIGIFYWLKLRPLSVMNFSMTVRK